MQDLKLELEPLFTTTSSKVYRGNHQGIAIIAKKPIAQKYEALLKHEQSVYEQLEAKWSGKKGSRFWMPVVLSAKNLLVLVAAEHDLHELYYRKVSATDIPRRIKHTFEHIKQVIRHVFALHDVGFAHMDLKHENVVLINGGSEVALVDFQFSVAVVNNDLPDINIKKVRHEYDGMRVGTYDFCCPQMVAREPYSAINNDFYCIGMMLFYSYTNADLYSREKSQTLQNTIKRRKFLDDSWIQDPEINLPIYQSWSHYPLWQKLVSAFCTGSLLPSQKRMLVTSLLASF
jgi:serine/threonine protein kinase